VSDGSFKNAIGTAAWVIQGDDRTDEIKGRCRVPGPDDWQSAYRSELCGMLGSIYCAITLAQKKGITKGKVRVGCDGLAALQQIMEYKITHTPLRKHYDLISAIRRLMRDAPIKVELFHIKGHQDDVSEAKLDRFALLNIDMDAHAKAHWTMVHDDDDAHGMNVYQVKVGHCGLVLKRQPGRYGRGSLRQYMLLILNNTGQKGRGFPKAALRSNISIGRQQLTLCVILLPIEGNG
jgi:hypothetical protein